MRFPKPRKIIVHGNVRWLVRKPKAMGGGREYCATKEDADKLVNGFSRYVRSLAHELALLSREDQARLITLLGDFGSVGQMAQAALAGKSKLSVEIQTRDAVKAFMADFRASPSRVKAIQFHIAILNDTFAARPVGAIEELELLRLMNARNWGPKTFNDCKQVWGQFWKYCIKRRWATENPASGIQSRKVPRSLVPIYTPDEMADMLSGLNDNAPELVAGIALMAFTGMRISEVARLKWPQVRAAMESGHLELSAEQVGKTLQGRVVPILPNLKAWLLKSKKRTGLILNVRIAEIGKVVTAKSGITWKPNALRHSFGTYRFKITNDVGQTCDEMGTSLAKFERHYRHRSNLLTLELAKDYFGI